MTPPIAIVRDEMAGLSPGRGGAGVGGAAGRLSCRILGAGGGTGGWGCDSRGAGGATASRAVLVSDSPHERQNFAPGETEAEHFGQVDCPCAGVIGRSATTQRLARSEANCGISPGSVGSYD